MLPEIRTRLKKSKAGIALVSVLLISVILLAMAAAFFTAHKADLALMGTSTRLEDTKNSALSAAEFFQYKVENDRFFGSRPFLGTATSGAVSEVFPADGDPLLEVTYLGNGVDLEENLVRGKIVKSDLEFEGVILNNLSNDSVGHHPRGTTPPRTVRIWIVAKKRNIQKKMDFILKRTPFSSVAMLSGGDVSVHLAPSEDGHWWLGARQPSGNGVRANGTISGPEILSRAGRAVLFEPPAGLGGRTRPPYGVLQGQNLRMQMDGVATDITPDNPQLERAQWNIRGALSPGGGTVDVPELDASKLAAPAKIVEMPANEITFRSREINGAVVHELLEDGAVKASYNSANTLSSSREYAWFDNLGEAVATFDLESRVMTVAEDVELQASAGPFTLRGVSQDSTSSNQPTLVLGSSREAAGIKASSGINIEGSVGGMGALKAGEGDLEVRAKSTLSTTPDFGVALHSDQDVILSKPGASNQDGIPADWDAFAIGFNSDPSSELSHWANQDEVTQHQLAASFSSTNIREAGSMSAGEDEVWLGLTKEFPSDTVAREAYDNWMQEHVPAVTGPDPDWVEPEPPEQSPPEIPVRDPETGRIVRDPETGEPVTIPDPEWEPEPWEPPPHPEIELEPAIPAGPGVNVEKYVRLREYLKTVKAGKPDSTWLHSNEPDIQLKRRNDAVDMVRNQLSSFQLAAGQTSEEVDGAVVLSWNSLGDYFTGRNPFLAGYRPDMKFRGLIYAGGAFRFDTQKQGIELEGALVSQGNMDISNATGARFIYNSELLEGMFATNEGDTSAKLERSYWAYY